ncbi:DUF512 domain-containing protein [candidate division WOR-3 bacterium]|nr:DUF512 domain-containing protein [candidate division WOR-3 bacterium]
MPVKIFNIDKKGLGRTLGLKPGDEIISVDGRDIEDSLDLSFWTSDMSGEIVWETNGKTVRKKLEDFTPSRLGIELEPFEYKRCQNRCIFCFVDQNPVKVRQTLNFKDDDYRLSFLRGAYITGTNLTESEIRKIILMRLSPVYISVHATDPDIRGKMFGLKKPAPVLPLIKRLSRSRIKVHTQIVVVPGINDGNILQKTLADLAKAFVASTAVVPVGLTKQRKNLYPIRELSRDEALDVIDRTSFASSSGRGRTSPVYCTDQMFLTAGKEIPRNSYYGDYPQLENGVGGLRLFLDETEKAGKVKIGFPLFLLTGEAMFPFAQKLAEKISLGKSKAKVIPVVNSFFGKKVTTAGLLPGKDFIKISEKLDDGVIAVPQRSLNYQGRFIDDITPEEIARKTGRNVFVCSERPRLFLNKLDKLHERSIKSKHGKTSN